MGLVIESGPFPFSSIRCVQPLSSTHTLTCHGHVTDLGSAPAGLDLSLPFHQFHLSTPLLNSILHNLPHPPKPHAPFPPPSFHRLYFYARESPTDTVSDTPISRKGVNAHRITDVIAEMSPPVQFALSEKIEGYSEQPRNDGIPQRQC